MKKFIFSFVIVAFSGYLVASEINYFKSEFGESSTPTSEDAIRLARMQNSEDEKKRNRAKGLPLVDKNPPVANLLHIN